MPQNDAELPSLATQKHPAQTMGGPHLSTCHILQGLCVLLILLEDGPQNARGESAGSNSVHSQSPIPHLHLSAQAGKGLLQGKLRVAPPNTPPSLWLSLIS
ncbi:unnamed protein product [Pipistrellus nathusii]|uniref:Uncharacterized protein n=1 Tax=Pipistrellus nathusii TaxID=59473 RepID=A0ABP0A6R6_PIPNA